MDLSTLKNFFYNTNDFQLTTKDLGKGSFGKVYVVNNIKDEKRYAIKILHSDKGFTGEDQMYLMRESIILHQLHHPSIVHFIGVNFQSIRDQNKFEPSIITEYLPNGSLKSILYLEKHSIADDNWNATKKYISLYGIANAMKYLHDHQIIHRDLKPENILIDANYYPRICDFGLSRCFQNNQLSLTTCIGSPMYMAPELLKGEKSYNSSVDVYAFSMLAYEIVSGKEPYYELGNIAPVQLGYKVVKGYRPNLNVGITRKMKNLLSRCWSPNEEERPSFDEICKLLSSDFSYLDEDIDEDEFNEYVENVNYISSSNEQHNEKENENEQKSEDELFEALDLLLGNARERNPLKSASYLQKSSEKGNKIASYILGLLYENGNGVDRDFKIAKNCYKQSVNQGNSHGLVRIGIDFYAGYGTDVNFSKSFKYFQKAAKLNNKRGINNVGGCYENGKGVERNYAKAIENYKKSFELGNSEAFVNLGLCYEKGNGVNQNYLKAFEYYKKSADLGHSGAMLNLGALCEEGKGVKQSYTNAFEYYKKSADLGETGAMYNLGLIYEKGKGVQQNNINAFEYYKKSADLGNSKAMLNVGMWYQNGIGVNQNDNKAFEYYQKSADLGNSNAIFFLGVCYEEGIGIKKKLYQSF